MTVAKNYIVSGIITEDLGPLRLGCFGFLFYTHVILLNILNNIHQAGTHHNN